MFFNTNSKPQQLSVRSISDIYGILYKHAKLKNNNIHIFSRYNFQFYSNDLASKICVIQEDIRFNVLFLF